jgi:hypothetical protein
MGGRSGPDFPEPAELADAYERLAIDERHPRWALFLPVIRREHALTDDCRHVP